MTISLIHPSRGRPAKAATAHKHWFSQAAHPERIEHILSLDFSDPDNEQYQINSEGKHVPWQNSKTIIDHNTCVVEATNQAAKLATGDILIYVSDDFCAPNGWDDEIEKRFFDVKEPMLLKVDDCLQPFDVDVLTIPIMNKELYQRLGYFFHPEYLSMFCDQQLYWVCQNNGWMKLAPELKFEHQHYSIGKAAKDATYQRSDANWEQGKALYAKHKSEGFPI